MNTRNKILLSGGLAVLTIAATACSSFCKDSKPVSIPQLATTKKVNLVSQQNCKTIDNYIVDEFALDYVNNLKDVSPDCKANISRFGLEQTVGNYAFSHKICLEYAVSNLNQKTIPKEVLTGFAGKIITNLKKTAVESRKFINYDHKGFVKEGTEAMGCWCETRILFFIDLLNANQDISGRSYKEMVRKAFSKEEYKARIMKQIQTGSNFYDTIQQAFGLLAKILGGSSSIENTRRVNQKVYESTIELIYGPNSVRKDR